MDRFYFIDKPLDITSFDVIRILRKKCNIRKMGHTGTLDPLATGGLFVATGNYTKLIPYFEKDDKQYQFCIELNGTSESFDLGTPVEYLSQELQKQYAKTITQLDIQKCIDENFTGTILQVPPKYSALKINGKKALERVKAGEEFTMKTREAEIKDIKILKYTYPKVTLEATVSAGTYIRSIARDMGEYFKTTGHISYLRRTKVGRFHVDNAQSLDDFEVENTFCISEIFPKEDFINISKDIIDELDFGREVHGVFDIPKNKNLFIKQQEILTHIIWYDGKKIVPKRKISFL